MDDGGPAFPTDLAEHVEGMTLLDYFAGRALIAGIITAADPSCEGALTGSTADDESLLGWMRTCGSGSYLSCTDETGKKYTVPRLLAEEAYDFAGAMLVERQKRLLGTTAAGEPQVSAPQQPDSR